MNRDKLVDLIRPGSGCALFEDTEYSVFKGIYDRTGDVCAECGYNPCERMKEDERRDKERRSARFGKHGPGTNADIAAKLKVSKRQVAKMRRRGEL